jgi:hypothetical protein
MRMGGMEDSRDRGAVRKVRTTRGRLEGVISRRVVHLRAVHRHAAG